MASSFTQTPIIGTLRMTNRMLPTQKLAIRPQKISGCSLISSGPGTMPWIIKAPSNKAMMASPGIPKLMVGMKSP